MDSLKHSLLILCTLLLCGCGYNDFELTLGESTESELIVNSTLGELSHIEGRVTKSMVAEGVVLTSDSTGNFFREILVREFNDNDTTVMRIPLYFYDIYSYFPQGSLIRIDACGLFVGVKNGLPTLGYTPLSGSSTPEAIPTPTLALEHLEGDYSIVGYDFEPTRIEDIGQDDIGRPVLLSGVYFDDTMGTMAGERKLVQGESSIMLYTSPYCSFAGDAVPEGLLDIRCIVEYYSGKVQLKLIRFEDMH